MRAARARGSGISFRFWCLVLFFFSSVLCGAHSLHAAAGWAIVLGKTLGCVPPQPMHLCMQLTSAYMRHKITVAPGAPRVRTGDVAMQHAHDAVRVAMVVDWAIVASRPDLQHEGDACASRLCHTKKVAEYEYSTNCISKCKCLWNLQGLLIARPRN